MEGYDQALIEDYQVPMGSHVDFDVFGLEEGGDVDGVRLLLPRII